jgi:hypothetical protein
VGAVQALPVLCNPVPWAPTCPPHRLPSSAQSELSQSVQGKYIARGTINTRWTTHSSILNPDATYLALVLPLVITLERDTRQETRYTLLDLDPVAHQLRQLLRPSLSLRNKLHLRRRSRIVPNTVLGGVHRCRLKDKRGAEVVLRSDPHLPFIVKCDLDAEDRRECLTELGRLGSEHLSEA